MVLYPGLASGAPVAHQTLHRAASEAEAGEVAGAVGTASAARPVARTSGRATTMDQGGGSKIPWTVGTVPELRLIPPTSSKAATATHSVTTTAVTCME